MKQEAQSCIKFLGNGKPPKLDNIQVEVGKTDDPTKSLLVACNKTLHENKAEISARIGLIPKTKKDMLVSAEVSHCHF